MKQYFSDFFEVSPDVIDEYGAFNISLISDLPLFIDPFLLFNSKKEEYRRLHEQMIGYLAFLKDKSTDQQLDQGLIKAWYKFPEVKQNWFGYSAMDNGGSGLGKKYADALHRNLYRLFAFGQETVTRSSHLEKLCLIGSGVGRDNISDFTTNLIKEFLLDYTQEFARRHLAKRFRRTFNVPKVRFNYETESWQSGQYELPAHNGDYVLLTPIDMLTKDETWINRPELVNSFEKITLSVSDEALRAQFNNYVAKRLHEIVGENAPKKKDKTRAVNDTIEAYPEIIDYYIRHKEENGDEAESVSSQKVAESKRLYLEQFARLGELLARDSNFYDLNDQKYDEALQRVQILKDAIENKDGYKVFYFDEKPIERESDLQILFNLTWRAKPGSSQSVAENLEPDNLSSTRKVKKAFQVLPKLAGNALLKRTLEKQIEESDEAASEQKPILAIFYFSGDELAGVEALLRQLKIAEHKNIVLIDARNAPKQTELAAHDNEQPLSEKSAAMNVNFTNGYALLVGVGADLPMTVQDAAALRDVLIDPRRAAYPPAQVQLLTEVGATRQAVLAAFDRLIEQSNRNPDATVIVYYSGHGGRIENAEQPHDYFLVPFGYDPTQFAETTVSSREFTAKIQAIKARTLIVLLDCCHAGGVPAVKNATEVFVKAPVPADLIEALNTGSGQVIVASSRENEYSIAATPYSIFTDCLLQALSGKAARKQDGYARIFDVLSYLFEEVPKRTNDRQHPFVNKITDLTDNFPVCYYAGGSKQLLDAPASVPVEPAIVDFQSAGERIRQKQKLDRLQSEWDLRNEKIGQMRYGIALEANIPAKFQLERQLLNEEAELSKLESLIGEIERLLRKTAAQDSATNQHSQD